MTWKEIALACWESDPVECIAISALTMFCAAWLALCVFCLVWSARQQRAKDEYIET